MMQFFFNNAAVCFKVIMLHCFRYILGVLRSLIGNGKEYWFCATVMLYLSCFMACRGRCKRATEQDSLLSHRVYFVSSREWPWHYWACQRIYAARRILMHHSKKKKIECVRKHMLRVWQYASSSEYTLMSRPFTRRDKGIHKVHYCFMLNFQNISFWNKEQLTSFDNSLAC